MSVIRQKLRGWLYIPWDATDDEYRRRLLNGLLLVLTVSTLIVIGISLGISALDRTSDGPTFRELYLTILALLAGNSLVFVLNRLSPRWAGWLFILFMVLAALTRDTPERIIYGQATPALAVPILLASFLLSPLMSFVIAGLSSLVITMYAQRLQHPVPFLWLAGLLTSALVSALLAHILRHSRDNSRATGTSLARLNQASQALNSTLDLDQVLVTFLDEVRHLMDVVACSVWLTDPETQELVCQQASGPKSEVVRGWRLAPGEGIAGQVARSGQSLIVADVWANRDHFPGVDQQTGLEIRSVIGVPLRIRQRLIGALEVVDTTCNRFEARDQMLLESLAASAAIAIENARLYEQAQQEIAQREQAEEGQRRALAEALQATHALQESEARYRNLFHGIPIGIFQTTPEGRFLDVNAACVQILGYPDRETLLAGSAASSYVNSEDRDRWRALMESKGIVRAFEMHWRSYNGKDIWVRESARTVRDAAGQILYYEGAMEDISEQKMAADKIRRQTEILAALHETTLDLAFQRELPDLLQAIVARAVDLLGAQGGGIYLYRPETDDLELAFTHNLEIDYSGAVLQRGEGLSGRVLESGRPMFVADYYHWEGQSERFADAGRPACIAVPIVWGDNPLGVLYLADDIPRTFSPNDIAILERFSPLAGAALEQTRLLEQARARWHEAETLRQAGAAVTEVLSLDERLKRILEQLGRVVPYDSASVQLLRGGSLEIVSGRGFPQLESVVGIKFPIPSNNPNTMVIEQRQTIILADAQALHPPFRESPHNHIRSWLGVPLTVRDQIIGILAVDSVELNHFNEEHSRLVTPFADQMAVALENARLYDDLQKQMVQLKATQTQLVQSAKLAAIGELAAGVAHELNNPLTSILGYAEIAMSELEPGSSCRRDLQGIATEAMRIGEIVRNLLNFARQAGPHKQPADINKVFAQSLTVMRYHLETSGLTIREDYARDIGDIPMDINQMRQVFLNLISNAFQAMPKGGELSVRTARIGDEVAVSIRDTGVGIPPEDQERIFDPFFSTEPSRTGLGLSVSLGIVQEHQGRITVESEPGHGSTFTVWLPVKTSTNP